MFYRGEFKQGHLEGEPTDVENEMLKTYQLIEECRYDEALVLTEKLLQKYPKNAEVHSFYLMSTLKFNNPKGVLYLPKRKLEKLAKSEHYTCFRTVIPSLLSGLIVENCRKRQVQIKEIYAQRKNLVRSTTTVFALAGICFGIMVTYVLVTDPHLTFEYIALFYIFLGILGFSFLGWLIGSFVSIFTYPE